MDRRRDGKRSNRPPATFGPRVRELRIAVNKTITEAALEASITESEWLLTEQGRRSPSLRVLLAMAKALRCCVGDMLLGSGERLISPQGEEAAEMFQRCPLDVQESVLHLLRGFVGNSGATKRRGS